MIQTIIQWAIRSQVLNRNFFVGGADALGFMLTQADGEAVLAVAGTSDGAFHKAIFARVVRFRRLHNKMRGITARRSVADM